MTMAGALIARGVDQVSMHGAGMKSLASTAELGSEARCECGQLVAKLLPDGVELKCKRCKRIVLIPFATMEDGAGVLPSPHP